MAVFYRNMLILSSMIFIYGAFLSTRAIRTFAAAGQREVQVRGYDRHMAVGHLTAR